MEGTYFVFVFWLPGREERQVFQALPQTLEAKNCDDPQVEILNA